MTQDLLNLVKPAGETGKAAAAAYKPNEKPVLDFLSVLDKALAERPADARPRVENPEAAPPAKEAARERPASVHEAGGERAADEAYQNARSEANARAEGQAAAAHKEREASGAADAAREQVRRQASGENPGKYQRLAEERPQVQTQPKPDTKNRIAASRVLDAAQAAAEASQRPGMAQTLQGQGLIKQLNPAGAEALAAADESRAAPTKKINRKSPNAEGVQPVGKQSKKLPATENGAAAVEQSKLVSNQAAGAKAGAKPSAELAAEKMQALGEGGKGLADALSVVKNLADKLGIAPAGPEQAAKQSVDLGRGNLLLVRNAPSAPTAAETEAKPANRSSGRVEALRAERLGRKDGGEILQQAADRGRVQLVDRSQAPRGSQVLESLLAERGKSGGRTEDGKGSDKLQLVNTAYFNPAAERSSVSIPVHLVASQNGNFQQALRAHLAERGNQDIVQQARIIMNGQDSGEIKLILKPENLGEVRIHLQMQDGRIAGNIFVENKEVQAAFQDNLQSLIEAFQDGGLATGNLQVSVDQRDQGRQGQQQADERSAERQKQYAVRSLESSVATVNLVESDYSQVNLVV